MSFVIGFIISIFFNYYNFVLSSDLVLPHFIFFYAFSGGGQTTSGSRFIAPSAVLECFLFVCLFLMLY